MKADKLEAEALGSADGQFWGPMAQEEYEGP
jgi:hypothetical protein